MVFIMRYVLDPNETPKAKLTILSDGFAPILMGWVHWWIIRLEGREGKGWDGKGRKGKGREGKPVYYEVCDELNSLERAAQV